VDRESTSFEETDGKLPLCDAPDRSTLEHVMYDSGYFIRISGKWILTEMTGDKRCVERFAEIGQDLQEKINAGKFAKPIDPKQFKSWKKMTMKFHDKAF